MTKYNLNQKVYVKSSNNTPLIISRYTYTLIIFLLISCIINLIIGNKMLVVSLIKSLLITLTIISIIKYIINITKKKYHILDIYTKDNTISIAIILALFGLDTNTYILLVACILTTIISSYVKNINLSSTLYGILIIMIYNTYVINNVMVVENIDSLKELISNSGGIINMLFSIKYLSPLLSIIMFIYLFYKKCIKYNIVIYGIVVFIISIFIYGLINSNIWLIYFYLCTSPFIFLIVYTATDYKATPTINEAQAIYGIILGIITTVLSIIVKQLSIPLAIIICSLLFSNLLDKQSYKIKYHKK